MWAFSFGMDSSRAGSVTPIGIAKLLGVVVVGVNKPLNHSTCKNTGPLHRRSGGLRDFFGELCRLAIGGGPDHSMAGGNLDRKLFAGGDGDERAGFIEAEAGMIAGRK